MPTGETSYIEADLVRLHLERSVPDPSGLERLSSNPVLAVGQFVSMPYLVGADSEAHERYQQDRLLIVEAITPGEAVTLRIGDTITRLALGECLVVQHAGEEIAVTLTDFTTRAALRAEADPS